MPANLTPDYFNAEDRFKAAQTIQEKIDALQEMIRVIPKHKGTDRLQGELKRKLSKLRQEAEPGGKKTASRRPSVTVERGGAGQVVLLGPPNSGKSSIVAALTRAEPEVAPYPFTTRLPCPGMLPFEDVQIQLVDLPPVAEGIMEEWLPGIVRKSDLALLVVDLGDDDCVDGIEMLRKEFDAIKVRFVGAFDEDPPPVSDPATSDEAETARGTMLERSLIVGAKLDLPGASENADVLRELFGKEFPILLISAEAGIGTEGFARAIFSALRLIRVYTRTPGKAPGKPEERGAPFTLRRGATALDLAEAIHKDIRANFRSARLWGKDKPPGIHIARDYLLQEGDLVEIIADA